MYQVISYNKFDFVPYLYIVYNVNPFLETGHFSRTETITVIRHQDSQILMIYIAKNPEYSPIPIIRYHDEDLLPV